MANALPFVSPVSSQFIASAADLAAPLQTLPAGVTTSLLQGPANAVAARRQAEAAQFRREQGLVNKSLVLLRAVLGPRRAPTALRAPSGGKQKRGQEQEKPGAITRKRQRLSLPLGAQPAFLNPPVPHPLRAVERLAHMPESAAVPLSMWRACKLTHVLRRPFVGHTRLVAVGCVSPAANALHATKVALALRTRAQSLSLPA